MDDERCVCVSVWHESEKKREAAAHVGEQAAEAVR